MGYNLRFTTDCGYRRVVSQFFVIFVEKKTVTKEVVI